MSTEALSGPTPSTLHNAPRRRRVPCAVLLLVGWIIPQIVLLGPSLIGRKVLLPLDLLKRPSMYLPARLSDARGGVRFTSDPTTLDLVEQLEPNRQYAVREVRAGRLPLWNPYSYCGAPFLAANQPAVFAPFRLIDYVWPGPTSIAWGRLIRAVVAGAGAYLFFRRAMRVRFLAAAIGAWCFPVSGFLVIWLGFPLEWEVTWLPLLLWATHETIRRPRGPAPLWLALVTAAVLVSGHSATGAQMLLLDGLYALWAIFHRYGWRAWARRPGIVATLVLVAAWIVGALLSGPQTLPTLAYMRHSYRMTARVAGQVETRPVGLAALPSLVLPWIEGTTASGSVSVGQGVTRLETMAAGYTGLVMTLVVAPLAWRSRRHRAALVFWFAAAVFGVGQILDVPLLARVYQAPVLNALRNNRLVFITSFAILTWGVAGLHVLLRPNFARRRSLGLALALLILPLTLGIYCLYRSQTPSPALLEQLARLEQLRASRAETAARGGMTVVVTQPTEALRWFANMHLGGALWCGAALLVVALAFIRGRRALVVGAIGLLLVAELVVRAAPATPLTDPALYYPRLPIFEALAARPPGRITGIWYLPPAFSLVVPLPDVRGYDAADPVRVVELLLRLQAPAAPRLSYAMVQWFYPANDIRALDLLNLRYVLARGAPPNPRPPDMSIPWAGDDVFIIERASADTRVFVPRHVDVVADHDQRLAQITQPDWNPRDALALESPPPTRYTLVRGAARITDDQPSRVTIEATMQTPGFVLLADQWDDGWRADVDGRETRVWIADHAFRAVEVPAGVSHVHFRYEPTSFRYGCYAALIGLAVLIIAAVPHLRRHRARGSRVMGMLVDSDGAHARPELSS